MLPIPLQIPSKTEKHSNKPEMLFNMVNTVLLVVLYVIKTTGFLHCK